MTAFRVLVLFVFSMFMGCDNNFDYVIHGQGEKEYIVTEPDAEIWIQSFRQLSPIVTGKQTILTL